MFNISHSNHAVLYGFTLGRRIGVDIEFVKPIPDIEAIAEKFFSRKERTELMTLPEDLRRDAFYHCWTRKEAVIKASGEGLSMPLDSFRVSLLPGEAARLITSTDNRNWTLQDLSPADGYAGTAAAPVELIEISYYSADFFSDS